MLFRWLIPNWSYSPWVFILALLACYAVSVHVRYQQFVTWQKIPEVFFVGERPMMTTADAPYWLRLARKYNEGAFETMNWDWTDELRMYPSGTKEFRDRKKQKNFVPQEYRFGNIYQTPHRLGLWFLFTYSQMAQETPPEKIHYRAFPLLSYLIAKLVPLFGGNYYLAGTMLIPWLASLFILPLGIYFYRIGLPSAGLLGGLVATFCIAYYFRSSIGRIDTDMLNLFFPALASLILLLAGRSKNNWMIILYSSLTGLSLNIFMWWYTQPGFIAVYFLTLFLFLVINRIKIHTILISCCLFIIFTDVTIFIESSKKFIVFVERYWEFSGEATQTLKDTGTNPASFPNVFQTITEAARESLSMVLQRILIHPYMGWIGFWGFALLVLFRWRSLLPLLPLLALGLLGFQTSRRFIMFLAPFIGIGLGYLLILAFNLILELVRSLLTNHNLTPSESKDVKRKQKKREERIQKKREGRNGKNQPAEVTEIQQDVKLLPGWIQKLTSMPWVRDLLVYGSTALLFFGISSQTAISFVPGPSIPTPLFATFEEVRKRVPPGSALLTWWDLGYALTDATRLATFHDGSSQFTPITYFIARSLTSSDPKELSDITQFIATEGKRGIRMNNSSPEALLTAVRNPESVPWDPIYLFFTNDMVDKYGGSIFPIGNWDLSKGGSSKRGYHYLDCQNIVNEQMKCQDTTIDLTKGLINKSPIPRRFHLRPEHKQRVPLKRVVHIMHGKVVKEKQFPHAKGYTLQIISAQPRKFTGVQLLEDGVYFSNFNQMFMLGNYDRTLFEETLNAFPNSRLYRFKFPSPPSG